MKKTEPSEEYPILDMAFPQYEYAHFRPIVVQYQEWSTMLQASIHKVLANGEEPRAVLEGLQDSVTEKIKN